MTTPHRPTSPTPPPDTPTKISRRQFLLRTTAAGAAGVGAMVTADVLRNRTVHIDSTLPQFGDYSTTLPAGTPRLQQVAGPDITQNLQTAIDAVGGIGAYVKPGDRVLIKPNVGFDRPADWGATTSPTVVAEVIRLCYAAGATAVYVTDYSINDPAGCFSRSGIGQAAEQAQATVLLPRAADMELVQLNGQRLTSWRSYYSPFERYRINRVIGVPTAKQHQRSVMSGAIKNWYGLLGGSRSRLHQDIDTVLCDLCGMMKPTLVVMDASRLLLRNGPTGGSPLDVLSNFNHIIAGTDQVAIDTLTSVWLAREARVSNPDPRRIGWLVQAQQRGLGTMSYTSVMKEPIVL